MISYALRLQLPVVYEQRICDMSTIQTLQSILFPGVMCVITAVRKQYGYD